MNSQDCESACPDFFSYERFTKGLVSCNVILGLENIRRRLSLGDFIDKMPGSLSAGRHLNLAIGFLKLLLVLIVIISALVANGYDSHSQRSSIDSQISNRSASATSYVLPSIRIGDVALSKITLRGRCTIYVPSTHIVDGVDETSLVSSYGHTSTREQQSIQKSSYADWVSKYRGGPRLIYVTTNGTIQSIECHSEPTKRPVGIGLAVASVFCFSFAFAGLNALQPGIITRISVLVAIVQTIVVWCSIGGSFQASILRVLPWCITIPTLAHLVVGLEKFGMIAMGTEHYDCGFATGRKRGMQGSFNCEEEKSSWIYGPEVERTPKRESDALRESMLRGMP